MQLTVWKQLPPSLSLAKYFNNSHITMSIHIFLYSCLLWLWLGKAPKLEPYKLTYVHHCPEQGHSLNLGQTGFGSTMLQITMDWKKVHDVPEGDGRQNGTQQQLRLHFLLGLYSPLSFRTLFISQCTNSI